MLKIIIAILIFSFIVIFHELGHFFVAKKCDVKVNEFWLGMGPTIFHFTKGETKFCLKLLPFGGACVMEGEDEESDDERAFSKKPLWQRALIVAAGPFMNFILAAILCIIVIAAMGIDKPIVKSLTPGYGGEAAGLMPGDEVTELGNYNVHFAHEVSAYIFFHSDEDIDVTYIRDGEENTVLVTPKYDEETGRYKAGIIWNNEYVKGNIFEDMYYGMCQMKYYIYTTFKSLSALITGRISFKEMSGPVGIVKAIGDTYEQSKDSGALYVVMNLLNLSALLSANLFIMNLLPIPALDGGRLLLFLVEAIRGKRLNEKLEGRIHLVGFVLLMALMVFVMYNDIVKLITG